jgi:hypothetical protein
MGYLGIDGRIFECEFLDSYELTHDKVLWTILQNC